MTNHGQSPLDHGQSQPISVNATNLGPNTVQSRPITSEHHLITVNHSQSQSTTAQSRPNTTANHSQSQPTTAQSGPNTTQSWPNTANVSQPQPNHDETQPISANHSPIMAKHSQSQPITAMRATLPYSRRRKQKTSNAALVAVPVIVVVELGLVVVRQVFVHFRFRVDEPGKRLAKATHRTASRRVQRRYTRGHSKPGRILSF